MSSAPAIPVFKKWGVKSVTKTDVSKGAYVPNRAQVAALDDAGIPPRQGVSFPVRILFDPTVSQVEASYYHSVRHGSGRKVEPRMGRDFISGWLKLGDEVVIGSMGTVVYAYKVTPTTPRPTGASSAPSHASMLASPVAPTGTSFSNTASGSSAATQQAAAPPMPVQSGLPVAGALPATAAASSQTPDLSHEEQVDHILATEDPTHILAKARQAVGAPSRRKVEREDFVRNPHVVAAAIHRANGACEMPNCTLPHILKATGGRYLEVHHIDPLAQGGDDTLANVAALCPHCHRALHHAYDRHDLRDALRTYIASLQN